MPLWNKKSIHELKESAEGSSNPLKRVLGPIDLILLGVGVIVGAGLFSITGIAAAENAGPAIVISFIIAAVGCALAGLCYCELASMIPICGSTYTYAYVTMGELAAWMIGWTLILEYAIGAAAVSISWSAYVVSFLHDFNIHLPSYLIASPWQPVTMPNGTAVYGLVNLPAVFIICLTSIINIIGVRESATINAIIVFMKMIVVLIFISVGFFYINPENYHPFVPENTGRFGEYGWSGILQAAGVVFFAYIGFDVVSTAAQEARHPQTSIPIGILGSLIVCTILYILFSIVMTGLVNYKELNVAAPAALAIDKTPYWWLDWMVKIAIIGGLTSVILVLLLGQSRIFYSMSYDGLLPNLFSEVHSVYKTPYLSIVVLMMFVAVFGAFAPIEMLGHMTSIGTLLAFVIVCAGVLVLRYTHPTLYRAFKTPWVPVIPVSGMLVCFSMMLFLGWLNWIRLIVWLAIGMLIYFLYSRHHSRLSAPGT